MCLICTLCSGDEPKTHQNLNAAMVTRFLRRIETTFAMTGSKKFSLIKRRIPLFHCPIPWMFHKLDRDHITMGKMLEQKNMSVYTSPQLSLEYYLNQGWYTISLLQHCNSLVAWFLSPKRLLLHGHQRGFMWNLSAEGFLFPDWHTKHCVIVFNLIWAITHHMSNFTGESLLVTRFGTDSEFMTFFFLHIHINNRAEQLFSAFSLVQALVRLTGQKLPDSQKRGILCRFDYSGIDWEKKIKPENGI